MNTLTKFIWNYNCIKRIFVETKNNKMSQHFFNEQLRNHVMDKLRNTITELVSDNSLDEIRTMLNDNEVTNGELVSDIQDFLNQYDNGRFGLDDLIPDEVLERYDI